MLEGLIKKYNEAVFDTDRDRALNVERDAIAQGITPEEVVFKVVLPAMDLMVQAISQNFDANLAQHFMTARIAEAVAQELIPKFAKAPKIVGRVVIGTAHGDLHSLGKRIVMGCLHARMIEVVDLGVNVTAERFVDEAVARKAGIIGISAMMVHTATGDNSCLKVRRILRERGLSDRIRIVVGGAPFRFDPELFRRVGADGWAENGVSAGKVIEDLMKEAG